MRNLILGVLMTCSLPALAQNNYGLIPVDYKGYQEAVLKNPENELVNLQEFIPGIVLDIRYATTNNFTHEKIYNLPRAYARRPVAVALKNIMTELKATGLGIKIYDAYRPYSATVKFYNVMKGDTTYVASPYKGSRHNRGCALDITLIDITSGKELQMPTPYDAMQKKSWPTTPVSDPIVSRNRALLIGIMERNGFKVYTTEWWHYDFTGWKKFDVMNIDFEQLEPGRKK